MRTILIAIFVMFFSYAQAQTIKGKVVERTKEGKVYEIPGASVTWKNTTIGMVTAADGSFELERNNQKILVVSFVGYTTKEVVIKKNQTYVEVELSAGQSLDQVNVVQRKRTAFMSTTKPVQTQVVTGEELCKAACCNLGESFETNASVDVAYADAVTGAKQIQMLGLTGQYVQMMTENMANFRGIASKFGLSYVPGAWMDAISISKGAGSVISGYESIAGQISVDYKKPERSEKFFINGYGNQAGKMELNSNFSFKLNKNWSTMFLLHGSQLNNKIDDNKDGFVDIPLSKQGNFINRWNFKNDDVNVQFGIKILDENRLGGQMDFDKDAKRAMTNADALANKDPYGINIDTRRYEAFVKTGILMPEYENTSMALLVNLTDHEQDSYYGVRDYYGRQKSAYVNYIFQSVFGDNENQKYSAGATFIHDNFDEKLENTPFTRVENVIGGFFQYTGIFNDSWTLMGGLRYDYHNLHGGFITPRIHIKWNPDENTAIRTSFGIGYRSANVIAENNTYLGSGRQILIDGKSFAKKSETQAAIDAMSDFKMEKALNFGINFHRTFQLFDRELSFSTDYYRTDFMEQVIVDLDSKPGEINFYNLNGKSFSDCYQAEVKYQVIPRLETTIAYRYNHVRQADKDGKMFEPALKSRYKGLLNLSYSTNMKIWQFDYTFQFNGGGRMPNKMENGKLVEAEDFKPFTVMNAQITKYFRNWSIYVGCENVGDFTQKNPILSAETPWDSSFDTSKVWGPIHGRKIYFGFRFAIDRD